LSPIPFNLYSKYLNKEAFKQFGDFKIQGQVNHTKKQADSLVLLPKEDMVLQGMLDRLIETGRCYGMEMNVGKNKIMRISRQPSSIQVMKDQRQMDMWNISNIWTA
jgi:hypothetical protein